MIVKRLTPSEWKTISEEAHLVVFNTHKPASYDRIDYALIVEDESHNPCAYLTARELDSETVYWQFGGSFPSAKGSIKSFLAYEAMVNWTRSNYKRITTFIENENTTMLKFAMKVGFRIMGIRSFHGSVLLEHLLEFKEN